MSALDAWLHRAPDDRRQCRCIYRGVNMGPRMGGYWHDHWHDEPCTVPVVWIGNENLVRQTMLRCHRAIVAPHRWRTTGSPA